MQYLGREGASFFWFMGTIIRVTDYSYWRGKAFGDSNSKYLKNNNQAMIIVITDLPFHRPRVPKNGRFLELAPLPFHHPISPLFLCQKLVSKIRVS